MVEGAAQVKRKEDRVTSFFGVRAQRHTRSPTPHAKQSHARRTPHPFSRTSSTVQGLPPSQKVFIYYAMAYYETASHDQCAGQGEETDCKDSLQ